MLGRGWRPVTQGCPAAWRLTPQARPRCVKNVLGMGQGPPLSQPPVAAEAEAGQLREALALAHQNWSHLSSLCGASMGQWIEPGSFLGKAPQCSHTPEIS